ncbi:capsular polysaccharide transport system permease protein [Loktanella ponticola]|uniref:Transport permease protein n=1 Tax=Yoonia ponticola TaxID=1524255 RepID=A0A7W9BN98_9RHOB|nr:ABC transporter permease [Yoonia ponticola]MBB5723606.1 capsular polysaccharide transport system permease protein [Yoonia ponticola]
MSNSTPTRGDMPALTPLRSILALMLREMGSTYGDSPGGYVWAILQPIGMIAILTVGFSLIIKSPALGTSFILFYATGFLTYSMFNQLMRAVLAALKYSKAMLAYPRVIWLDAILARFLLNALTFLTVFCIVITGVLVFDDTRTVITIQPIIVGLMICMFSGLGVGMINCLLIGLFPVWEVIWKILTRPLFIASGVIFIYEDMPRMVQDILWWNPVLHATGLVRTGFYPNYHASYVSLTYCFAFSMILIAFALLMLWNKHAKILNR